jgi:hypothetical protein
MVCRRTAARRCRPTSPKAQTIEQTHPSHRPLWFVQVRVQLIFFPHQVQPCVALQVRVAIVVVDGEAGSRADRQPMVDKVQACHGALLRQRGQTLARPQIPHLVANQPRSAFGGGAPSQRTNRNAEGGVTYLDGFVGGTREDLAGVELQTPDRSSVSGERARAWSRHLPHVPRLTNTGA